MKKFKEFWNYIQETFTGRREKTKEKAYKRMVANRNRWEKDGILNVDNLIMNSMGRRCPYCLDKVTPENMSLDHMTPKTRGGLDDELNIHLTCKRCNTRKGILTDEEFNQLLNLLSKWEQKPRKYVLGKLSYRHYGF